MTDLEQMYKLQQATSRSRYLILLFLLVLFFVAQCYLVYFVLIPNMVGLYSEVMSPDKSVLLEYNLYKLVSWWLVWPIMLFFFLLAMIMNTRKMRRLYKDRG